MSTEEFGFKRRQARRSRSFPTLRDWVAQRRTTAVRRITFSIVAAAADAAAITVSAVLVGVGYHVFAYHVSGMAGIFLQLGLLLALLFVIINALRDEYSIPVYLAPLGHGRRAALVWNMTFLTALVFVFAIKETGAYSRAAIILLYGVGLAALVGIRRLLVRLTRRGAVAGHVSALRVVIVGEEAEVRAFNQRYQPWTVGLDVVASAILRGPGTLGDDLALAAATARVLQPDDIFVLVPWGDVERIDACIDAFLNVPAAIHLGPQPVFERFGKARVSHLGGITSLHLVRQPLSVPEVLGKRMFDLVVASLLLLALSPAMLAIAVAIRLDSRGPVFFRQQRYGFNQRSFTIFKFRSMTVAEDGGFVRQAVRDDPRVTRVGRLLRRYNLDELPQLLNVLRGEMSLVGPRPHALVHNQQFERSIAEYARRHNVKPGITGWAQIHGLRGEVSSDGVMRARVAHDLYYIDNWSFGLDLRILSLTLFSPGAYRNAY